MKKILLIVLLATTFMTAGYAKAYDETQLPSQQTSQQFGKLPSEVTEPELRAKPPTEDGDGGAQKFPLEHGYTSIVAILSASAILAYRKYFKQKKAII